jgi:hypothetical protein
MTLDGKPLTRQLKSRQIHHAARGKSARQIIGVISSGMEIYGISGGHFCLINLIEELIDQIGDPVDIDIASWTIAEFELARLTHYVESSTIKRCRFLTDISLRTRHLDMVEELQTLLGHDNVRLLRCHCKFVTIVNDAWNIALRTSMNLNENRRFENFEISDDKTLCDYMVGIVNQLFAMPYDGKCIKRKEVGNLKRESGEESGFDDLGFELDFDDLFSGVDIGGIFG